MVRSFALKSSSFIVSVAYRLNCCVLCIDALKSDPTEFVFVSLLLFFLSLSRYNWKNKRDRCIEQWTAVRPPISWIWIMLKVNVRLRPKRKRERTKNKNNELKWTTTEMDGEMMMIQQAHIKSWIINRTHKRFGLHKKKSMFSPAHERHIT